MSGLPAAALERPSLGHFNLSDLKTLFKVELAESEKRILSSVKAYISDELMQDMKESHDAVINSMNGVLQASGLERARMKGIAQQLEKGPSAEDWRGLVGEVRETREQVGYSLEEIREVREQVAGLVDRLEAVARGSVAPFVGRDFNAHQQTHGGDQDAEGSEDELESGRVPSLDVFKPVATEPEIESTSRHLQSGPELSHNTPAPTPPPSAQLQNTNSSYPSPMSQPPRGIETRQSSASIDHMFQSDPTASPEDSFPQQQLYNPPPDFDASMQMPMDMDTHESATHVSYSHIKLSDIENQRSASPFGSTSSLTSLSSEASTIKNDLQPPPMKRARQSSASAVASASSSRSGSASASTRKLKRRRTSGFGSRAERVRWPEIIPRDPNDTSTQRRIICDDCQRFAHLECVGIREADYSEDDQDLWRCPVCTTRGPGPRRVNDPRRSLTDEGTCLRQNCPTKKKAAPPEFVIESIVGRRPGLGNTFQYLIKWWGYGMEECEWKPETEFRASLLLPKFREIAAEEFLDLSNRKGTFLLHEAIELWEKVPPNVIGLRELGMLPSKASSSS